MRKLLLVYYFGALQPKSCLSQFSSISGSFEISCNGLWCFEQHRSVEQSFSFRWQKDNFMSYSDYGNNIWCFEYWVLSMSSYSTFQNPQ